MRDRKKNAQPNSRLAQAVGWSCLHTHIHPFLCIIRVYKYIYTNIIISKENLVQAHVFIFAPGFESADSCALYSSARFCVRIYLYPPNTRRVMRGFSPWCHHLARKMHMPYSTQNTCYTHSNASNKPPPPPIIRPPKPTAPRTHTTYWRNQFTPTENMFFACSAHLSPTGWLYIYIKCCCCSAQWVLRFGSSSILYIVAAFIPL